MDKSGNVLNLLSGLNSEAETEAAKFGEDVKHLADVTNSNKKFDPWIAKSMEKAELIMDFFGYFQNGKFYKKKPTRMGNNINHQPNKDKIKDL